MLMGALGISRTTSDTARIAGALAGTGGVALLGMGAAYAIVTLLYLSAFVLSLNVAGHPGRPASGGLGATVADLRQGFAYVWDKDELLGAFSMVGDEIFFSHSFLGRRLRPEQLIASLDMVASTSDEYDEQIVSKYGGETALERLRGQRQPLMSGSPHN